ncbi:hypothetical protein [Planctomicrobium sp. SH664]|uniref:hypothetical protein n=1 Tax=Planctomicrobium sp. SH664 TaxID=3448125 RepID=UPI003F5B0EB1
MVASGRRAANLTHRPQLLAVLLVALCGLVNGSSAEDPEPTPAAATTENVLSGESLPLPPLPAEVAPENVFSEPPWFEGAPGALPGGPVSPCPPLIATGAMPGCPQCPEGYCYRGVDHLGNCFHDRFGECNCFARAADNTVLAVHGMFDHLCFGKDLCQAGIQDTWIGDRQQIQAEQADPVRAALQCKFVNWRLNSMYLVGCMPEGYNLYPFIVSVPSVVFSPGPACPDGVLEPGADVNEAEQIDGNTHRALAQISLNITPPKGELPSDRAAVKFAAAGSRMHLPGTQRTWATSHFYWNASLLNHQPLYFEDVNLERHGFSYGLAQPLVSGVKFFATIPTLPYQVIAQPAQMTQYTLGEARPGDNAPYVHERLRRSLDATVVEAAVIVGLVFLIP